MPLFDLPEDVDPSTRPRVTPSIPRSLRHGRRGHNSYRCPDCGGGFDVWDTAIVNGGKEDRCPFCGLVRGQYDPEDGGGD